MLRLLILFDSNPQEFGAMLNESCYPVDKIDNCWFPLLGKLTRICFKELL